MEKKTIIILMLFVAILFAIMLMPSKVMAVEITSVKIDNEIPEYDKALSNNVIVNAYNGETDLSSYVSVSSATWFISTNGTTDSAYDGTKKLNNEKYVKLVTTINADSGYTFNSGVVAKGNDSSSTTGVQIDNTKITVNSPTSITVTSIYWRFNTYLNTTPSVNTKLMFMDENHINYISYHLPGSTVSISAIAFWSSGSGSVLGNEINYKPTNIYVFDETDNNSNTYSYATNVHPTKSSDDWHYTFEMPSYSARIEHTNTRAINVQVKWKEYDFFEHGSGRYKISTSGGIEKIGASETPYNFEFNKETFTLIVKDLTENDIGEKNPCSIYNFGEYVQNYLYVSSSDENFENFTLKTIGYCSLQMPKSESYDSIPIYISGANLKIENPIDNVSVYNISTADNLNKNNCCIYCNKNISIVNYDTEKQDSLKILCNSGDSLNYGIGIYAKNNLTIQNSKLDLGLSDDFSSGNKSNRGIIGIYANDDITLKDVSAKITGDLFAGINAENNLVIDGGDYTILSFLQANSFNTYTLWGYDDIIIKNQAKLKLSGKHFIGKKSDEDNGSKKEIDLTQYDSPYRILVEETNFGPKPKEWNGTTNLSYYSYMEIAPGTPTGEDIYINKYALEKIRKTIDQPYVGHNPAKSGQIISTTPNLTAILDIDWHWRFNLEGYTGFRHNKIGDFKFKEGEYYFIYLYIKQTEDVQFDINALRTPGNVTVNGQNVLPKEIEFNQDNLDGSPGRNTVICFCFGELEYSYDFINNTDNQTIYQDVVLDVPITWTIDGNYAKFSILLVGGTEFVKDTDYTVEEGSTKITLTDAGKNKILALGVGSHTVTANFTGNNSATTTLTITEKPVYTVTFDAKGHGTAPDNQSITEGNKATKPADLTAEGYTFGGWYEDATFNKPFDFENTAITSNTTIYAKWTAINTADEEITSGETTNGETSNEVTTGKTTDAEANVEKDVNKVTTNNPKTGDNIYTWIGVFAISLFGTIVTKNIKKRD